MMKMGKKYDFIQFKEAEQVLKDFPAIIVILRKLIPVLEDKKHYTAVWLLLQTAQETKKMLEMQFNHYKKINENKGKIDE